MLTLAKLGGPAGLTVTPSMVATNERYLGIHELTFSLPESYAQMLNVGMPILFTWFPDIEFILVSVAIDASTCQIKCVSTEHILNLRPSAPDIRSTEWKSFEYPNGWDFGDELDDVARVPIQSVLQTVWDGSTSWFQNSGFNQGPVDLVSTLEGDFSSGVTGNLSHYIADGTLFESIQELVGMSTTRSRLKTRRVDSFDDYVVSFYTEPCRDRARSIRVNNFRSEVRNIRTNIDITDKPSRALRSNEDGVAVSELFQPVRNYVTMSTAESADFDLSLVQQQMSFQNQLVYEPYTELSGGYTVEFEFHGELDLQGLAPGDTVTTDSNHPRPTWVPDELMITEIVRTFDHLGYREYPLLTTVPAVYGRDNVVTKTIKQSIRSYDAN